MIRQQVGDLLEVELDGEFFYLVVLSKLVLFGGNIVFAYYTDGKMIELKDLDDNSNGFLVCSDLLYAKQNGNVRRLKKLNDLSIYWKTNFAKLLQHDQDGDFWLVYDIHDLENEVNEFRKLPEEYYTAMDHETAGIGVLFQKIKMRYSPELNESL